MSVLIGRRIERREMEKPTLITALMLLLLASAAFVSLVQPVEVGPSISLTKTPSATLVESGSIVSYLYNASNTGETALTGGIYDDVYGSVGSFVDLAPGGWVGFNVSHTITDSTTNIATAYGLDKFGRNVTSTDSAFVEVPGPEISVTKNGDPVTQIAPGTITWNVTVTNTGGYSLTGVNVSDTRHGYLGSIGTLDPGQTIFFVIIESSLPPGTYYDNATAVATSQYGAVSGWDDATCIICSGNPTIESCDSAGVKKDTFAVGDDVYANGTCYRPQTTYDIYVVEDVTWVDGMAIPPRVPDTATTVTTDAYGNIPPTLLWSSPLEPGKYDIIVDVDGDGLYYAEADAIDDNDIEVTAGYFVVPEVPLGTITAAIGMFGALVGFAKFKSSRPQFKLK
jgi:hypothetical protein